MATYQRRKKIKKNNKQLQESLSESVFENVDQGAGRLEAIVLKSQNYIYGGVIALLVAVLGYFGYTEYVQKPREEEVSEVMFDAIQHFEKSEYQKNPDSLLMLALNGSKFLEPDTVAYLDQQRAPSGLGFLEIIDAYGDTKAVNLARYYAGISYFRLKKYDEALGYLKNIHLEDELLPSIVLGVIGDCYAEKKDINKALSYYEKAFQKTNNDLTTPRYLFKATLALVELDDYTKAMVYVKRILREYPVSLEAQSDHFQFVMGKIEGMIGEPIF